MQLLPKWLRNFKTTYSQGRTNYIEKVRSNFDETIYNIWKTNGLKPLFCIPTAQMRYFLQIFMNHIYFLFFLIKQIHFVLQKVGLDHLTPFPRKIGQLTVSNSLSYGANANGRGGILDPLMIATVKTKIEDMPQHSIMQDFASTKQWRQNITTIGTLLLSVHGKIKPTRHATRSQAQCKLRFIPTGAVYMQWDKFHQPENENVRFNLSIST